jgi:hypothetical protein
MRVRLPLRFAFGDLAHKIDDAPTDLSIPNSREGSVQLKTFDCGDDIRNKRSGAVLEAGFDAQCGRRPLEKEGWRRVQQPGNRLQPARTYPIRAFFIFLHLLECDPERTAEFLLAHAKHHSTEANSASDMLINRVWIFCQCHLRSRFQATAHRC